MITEQRATLSNKQQMFIDTLNEIAGILDSLGLSRDEWMIIAGGGVFLYQLDRARCGENFRLDREPTDLDVVVSNITKAYTNEDILKILYDAMKLKYVSFLRHAPLMHFGHRLMSPALETVLPSGLSVDFTTELSQIYPPDHRFTPSMDYRFPNSTELIANAKMIENPFLHGPMMVANPVFIAFYKLMLFRNTEGKQDGEDLIRLKELGLLASTEEREDQIRLMCHNQSSFVNAVKRAILVI